MENEHHTYRNRNTIQNSNNEKQGWTDLKTQSSGTENRTKYQPTHRHHLRQGYILRNAAEHICVILH